VYRDCLCSELRAYELFFQRDVPVSGSGKKNPVVFDFVVENSVAVMIRNGFAAATAEKKALNKQLEDAGLVAGLVFNFNELDLQKGTWQTLSEARKTEFWY